MVLAIGIVLWCGGGHRHYGSEEKEKRRNYLPVTAAANVVGMLMQVVVVAIDAVRLKKERKKEGRNTCGIRRYTVG